MEYEVFSDPGKVYDKMLFDIGEAKTEILLETHTYDDDDIGRKFRDVLLAKAREGVKIRLLLDFYDCNVDKSFFRELIVAGGEVRIFKKYRYTALSYLRTNHQRNHRKLLLIDRAVSYFGSMNITASCLGWRELVLRICGGITNSFRISFYRTWKRFDLFRSRRMRKIKHEGFEILQDFPSRRHGVTERSYVRLIKKAKREVLIETPYFLPPRSVRRALKRAAKRGVKVVIVLPVISDVKYLDAFRNRYLGALHRKGVEIHYYPKMSHSKLLIVDEESFLFGSSNLDYRSFRHQYEINVLGRDEAILESLKFYFREGLGETIPFDYSVWEKRHFLSHAWEGIMNPFRRYF